MNFAVAPSSMLLLVFLGFTYSGAAVITYPPIPFLLLVRKIRAEFFARVHKHSLNSIHSSLYKRQFITGTTANRQKDDSTKSCCVIVWRIFCKDMLCAFTLYGRSGLTVKILGVEEGGESGLPPPPPLTQPGLET